MDRHQTDAIIRDYVHAAERMGLLARWADSPPPGGIPAAIEAMGITRPIRWAVSAPTTYQAARETLESALEDARRARSATADELDALAAMPQPLTGSSDATELTGRVRAIETRRRELAQTIRDLETALDRQPHVPLALDGMRRVLRTLFSIRLDALGGFVASRIGDAVPHVRAAVKALDEFAELVAWAEGVAGEPLTRAEVILPELAAWRAIAERGRGPVIEAREIERPREVA